MIAGLSDRLRGQLASTISKHPFLRLVTHFCSRATGSASTSDFDFGLGGLLALLAVPGAFSSILLMDKYSSLLQYFRGQQQFNPFLSCLPDEYFFIVYSMSITGLITLLRWNQLLPDARDFANLGTLSLSLRKIFMANVIALATLAGLFAIDINAVSVLVFPVLVTIQVDKLSALLQVLFAHTLATIGISVFAFLSVIALQGLLMSLLPERAYRRVALALRTLLLILLTGTLISVFLVPMPFLQVRYSSGGALRWWPPLWFLSLFESCITELRSRAALGSGFACLALVTALALTVCGFSLSYKRYFLKIPERQPASIHSQRSWAPFPSAINLFRPILRPGVETACFQFILRTLLRSETHLLFTGLWTGVGLLLALQGSRQNSAGKLLMAPLTFALFSLAGIRSAFDISSSAHANWAFRLVASDAGRLVRSASRKLLLLFGVTPLFLIWFPIAVQQAGARLASFYLWFHVILTLIMVELLIGKLNRVPFTCSLPASRDRFLKLAIGILVILLLGIPALGRLEGFVVNTLLALPFFIGVLMVALIWLYQRNAGESPTVIFEETAAEAFVVLRLGNE